MKKGKFYYGIAGVGKTTRLKGEYEALESKLKRWATSREVSRTAQMHGLLGVENMARNSFDLFIGDIGHEIYTINHYGTVISPMADLIQARYDHYHEWPQWEMTTHFTSNLSPDELRIRYGDFVFDRLVEMCEWIEVQGQSFRK